MAFLPDAAVVPDHQVCYGGHTDTTGLSCTRCHRVSCIQCLAAATAPTLRDPDELTDFLSLDPGTERNPFPFECLLCWDGTDMPPSLGRQLLDAGANLTTRQEFKERWLTDFGRTLRNNAGLQTDGHYFRKQKKPPDDNDPGANDDDEADEDDEFFDCSTAHEWTLDNDKWIPDKDDKETTDTSQRHSDNDDESATLLTPHQSATLLTPHPTPKSPTVVTTNLAPVDTRNPSPKNAAAPLSDPMRRPASGPPPGAYTSTPRGATGTGGNYRPYTPNQLLQPFANIEEDNGREYPHYGNGVRLKEQRHQQPHKEPAPDASDRKNEGKRDDGCEDDGLRKIVTQQQKQIDQLLKIIQNNQESVQKPAASERSAKPQYEDEFLVNLVRAASRTSHTSLSTPSSNAQPPIKAVPIELPRFDGDYTTYISFARHLDYHIHRNPQLSEVEKFAILRAHLDGAAADKIKDLDGISEASYRVAKELLDEVYGDRFAAKDLTIREFNDYSGTQKYEGSELEVATDRLRILVSKCREADVPEAYLNTSVTEVLRKLPDKVREDILDMQEENAFGVPTTINEVLACMRKHAKRAVRNERNKPRNQTNAYSGHYLPQDSSSSQDKGHKSKTSNQTRQTDSPHKTNGGPEKHYYRDLDARPCFYCGGRHTEFSCREPIEKRIQKVKDTKACYNCLSTRHSTDDCRRPGICLKCKANNTIAKHHTTLCPSKPASTSPKEANENGSALTVNSIHKGCIQAHFQTTAVHPTRNLQCNVVVLVDQGSTDSFILEATAEKLKLPTLGYRVLRSATCFESDRKSVKARRVELDLKTMTGNTFRIEALAVQNLVPDITLLPIHLPPIAQKMIDRGAYVANAPPEKPMSTPIQILLGNAVYGRVMRPAQGCQQMDDAQNMVAYDTPFGIILSGSAHDGPNEYSITSDTYFHSSTTTEEDPLVTEIRKNWELETIGISLHEKAPNKDRSPETTALLDNATTEEDGRWSIRLPFKSSNHHIHSNWGKAFGRLRSICRKLTDSQRITYFKTWSDLIDAGFLEEAPDVTEPDKDTHHLPHFAVVKESSLTTKVRPVLDAAAETVEGGCLNDLLVTGPQVGETLLNILLRFRIGLYAIVSDVAKAFYAIAIAAADRDFVRVLLPKDPNKPIEKSNVKTWRYTRLVMGATCSSWILMTLLNETLQRKIDDPTYNVLSEAELNKVKKSFYADNSIYCIDTIEDGQRMAKHSQIIFDGHKFHLREFCATDEQILNDLAPEDIHQLPIIKVLGIDWGTIMDTIKLHENKEYDNEQPSRRELVSMTASVYDPYGLFAPVMIRGRMIERAAVNEKTAWDEKISTPLQTKWLPLREDIKELHNITLPRNVRECPTEPIRLVGFSDASCEAFAAAIYVWQWVNGEAKCHLLVSRSKLRPKDDAKATIPRMELLGLHCAAQLMSRVTEALTDTPIASRTLYSDSQIALHWAHSTKRLPPYEGNRVSDIRETEILDLRFVPTKENPADLPTRGLTTKELKESMWFQGPKFLTNDFPKWHKPWKPLPTDDEVFAMFISTTIQAPPDAPFGLDPSDYDSLDRLLKITSYAQRFAYPQNRSEHKSLAMHKSYLLSEPAPRGTWKLVRVLEVYPDSEGTIRTCKVRLPSGTMSKRSTSHLVPLELADP